MDVYLFLAGVIGDCSFILMQNTMGFEILLQIKINEGYLAKLVPFAQLEAGVSNGIAHVGMLFAVDARHGFY